MSDSLVWHLIRDNNSFLVKRGHKNRQGAVKFSKEPGNILASSSFKWSGIANSKTYDIQDAGKGHGAKVTVKVTKDANSPKNGVSSTNSKTFKAIDGYRTDLNTAAKIRFNKIARGGRVKRYPSVNKASRVGPRRSSK